MEKIQALCTAYVTEHGTTLEALAVRLGISRISLWKKLNGRVPFSLREAFELRDILDCDMNLFRPC